MIPVSRPKEWKFKESQRDAVCKGKLCPSCLEKDIESLGYVPTPTELNQQFRCKSCKEEWEGY